VLALISDLHSNMEAIRAVLDDIASQGITRIACLGDVVGYGPEPRLALAEVSRFEFCLRGNHEEAVLYFAEDFNEKARAALDWTRDQLNDPAVPREERFEYWRVLSDVMKVEIRTEDALYVHGSPRDPIREYMLPADAKNAEKMRGVFAKQDRAWCFVGHSHVPGVYVEGGGFISPKDCDGRFTRTTETVKPGSKVLVNIGSVGQPRDGDPRSSYVVFDGQSVWFRRVPYDVETTMKKILATKVLPSYLAERLKVGR
jgi:diadenosine tetraphosphatase ApaH/serine/threonine PP2A family protein phosphatase